MFYGATFSPDSASVVYSRTSQRNALFPTLSLEVAPTAGGAPRRLVADPRAMYPLWGPTQIAYSRYQRPARRGDGPKVNLWLVNPDGSGRRQLTHDKVPFLLFGLTATDWSADGTRLLCEFGGQDTAYAVTVDPRTGAETRDRQEVRGLHRRRRCRPTAARSSAPAAASSGPGRPISSPRRTRAAGRRP